MKARFAPALLAAPFLGLKVISCLTVCAILITSSAQARIWYINAEGTGDFPTIQAAVDRAADGDIIELADGTYTSTGNWDVLLRNRTLWIRSENNDPELSIIDGSDGDAQHRAFSVEGGNPQIQGIGFFNCNHTSGGAVHIAAGSPIFINCELSTCTAISDGGAVHVEPDGSPEFDDCEFRYNAAGRNGGAVSLAVGATSVFTSCTFWYNNAVEAGGGLLRLPAMPGSRPALGSETMPATRAAACSAMADRDRVSIPAISIGTTRRWEGGPP